MHVCVCVHFRGKHTRTIAILFDEISTFLKAQMAYVYGFQDSRSFDQWILVKFLCKRYCLNMVLAPITKGHLILLKMLKFRQKVYLGQDDDEDATITKRKGKRERESITLSPPMHHIAQNSRNPYERPRE